MKEFIPSNSFLYEGACLAVYTAKICTVSDHQKLLIEKILKESSSIYNYRAAIDTKILFYTELGRCLLSYTAVTSLVNGVTVVHSV